MKRAAMSVMAIAAASVLMSAAEPVARTVYVSVVDSKGAPIENLTAADFAVKEGGKDYELASAGPATAPMQMVIVVDDNATGAFRGAVASLVQSLLAKGEFSIMTVLGHVNTATDFTNAPDKLRDAIGTLTQRGGAQDGAYLLDGILEAGKSLEKRHATRPVIVALTVGSATDRSGSGPGEVLRQLKQSMASLNVVSIANALISQDASGGKVGDLMERTVGINQVLDDGPKQSGGKRMTVTSMPEVTSAVARIADQLQHQYVLSYRLPDGVKLNERLQVTVKKSGASVLAPTKIADK